MASDSVEEILKAKYPAKEHVKKVIAYLKENDKGFSKDSVLYLEAAHSRFWPNCDQEQPFRQDRAFLYLTGCDVPDCRLVVDVEKEKSTLFIPPVVDDEVIWSGLPLSPDEALKKYDIDTVLTTTSLQSHLSTTASPTQKIYAIANHYSSDDLLQPFSQRDTTSLQNAINNCRVTKDAYEIALIRQANSITNIAHRAVLRAARTASNEQHLAAIFVERCSAHGAINQAYSPIVASGTDAATLHYVRNNKPITGSTLNLLIDAGAEWRCYASDVTRTFPINGKFTPESAGVYKLVQRMQEECMAMCKPGADWDEIHAHAHKVAAEGLIELGILKGSVADVLAARTTTLFFPHGLGHYMGLDTHDTGGNPNYEDKDSMFRYLRKRGPLPVGAVITVEPGVYFCRFIVEPRLEGTVHSQFIDRSVLERYWAVGGVRIEDDILITETGWENMTGALPRRLEEIEKLMVS